MMKIKNQKKKDQNKNTKNKKTNMQFLGGNKKKRSTNNKPIIIELLTRGKEVIVEWLLGLLVWVVDVVVV